MAEARIVTPFGAPPDAAARRATSMLHPASARLLPWALAITAVISLYYVFLASAGRFIDVPRQLDYYDQMAEGFRHGHLYVQKQPAPQLLASSNPFDPKFFPIWLWDASLYNGHYYMYWGPVPGLALLAYKVITRTQGVITDQWITTLLTLGRLYAGVALIGSLASRARIRQPAWVVCLAIAVFGLANPVPFTVARPHIYEGSLMGGQCFLFWGLVAAFWGVELPARRRWLFALASASFGLASGCRATVLVAVPFLIVISAGFAWYGGKPSWRERLRDGLALVLPVGLAVGAYGAYNYARFDSVTEFGLHYQATLQPFYGKGEFVVPNVFAYLLAPVMWSCHFPYVTILGGRAPSALITWPPGYLTFERVGGVLLTAWWCWLALVWVYGALRQLSPRTRSVARSSSPTLTAHELWASLCAIACVLTVLPVLTLWEASMRYVGDAIGGLVVVSTLAAFGLLERARASRNRIFAAAAPALVVVLGLQTCVIGALAAFTSYDDPLKTANPVLYKRLERTLSVCALPG